METPSINCYNVTTLLGVRWKLLVLFAILLFRLFGALISISELGNTRSKMKLLVSIATVSLLY